MLFFYTVIVALGIFSSYTDLKFSKIKNRHLVKAAISGIIIYAYLVLSNKIDLNANLIINLFIGLGLGFLLYFTDTWGAGDAKLFAVFCLLMPTKKYSEILPFASLVVFINIFALSTLFLLASSLLRTIQDKDFFLKEIFSAKTLGNLATSFVIVFSLGWIILSLSDALKVHFTPFLHTLFLYFSFLFVFTLVRKLKRNYLVVLILALCLALRFKFRPSDFAFQRLLSYFSITFLYSFAFCILGIIFHLNRKKEKNENIMPFAPLMFLGTLASETDLIYLLMRVLSMLRK